MVEWFFLFAEVLLVGVGLFGLTMLTNIWWALLSGSVLGVIAMEKALSVTTSRARKKLAVRR